VVGIADRNFTGPLALLPVRRFKGTEAHFVCKTQQKGFQLRYHAMSQMVANGRVLVLLGILGLIGLGETGARAT